MSSNFEPPIPETFCNSSTLANGPFFVRYVIIRAASTGPMPGSESNSDLLARLIFIFPRRAPPELALPPT